MKSHSSFRPPVYPPQVPTIALSGGTISGLNTFTRTGGTLDIGGNTLTVATDYNNAFGTGNSFNPYAGVTLTSGAINASNAGQQITGTNVTNGSTANATLALGNVRVGGSTTANYVPRN